MSRIDRGKKVTLTFRENRVTGKATLIIDVAADDDILPHEHREDMRQIAAAILQVPVSSLEDVEVELKRKPAHDHDHPHGHEHEHEPSAPVATPAPTPMPDKARS
jgi:hypothetical protein